MKACLSCQHQFASEGWQCPACGAEPRQAPFPEFAPELAEENDNFDASAFELLARWEPGSFWFRGRNRLISTTLAEHFPCASSFLEIGCGTGFVLSHLRERFPSLRLSGAEIYTEGLRIAAQRLPGVSLYQMDCLRIPFREEFDVVGMFDVLEHLDDDGGALREVFRAVRPGGGVLITVPQHPALWSAADEDGHHRRRYRRSELAARLAEAGFVRPRFSSFVSFLLPGMALARLRHRLRPPEPGMALEFDLARPVDRTFEAILNFETWLIRRGVSLPAGGSLLAVAHRPS